MNDLDLLAANKRRRLAEQGQSLEGVGASLADLMENRVTQVGSVDPVKDFERMLKRRDDPTLIDSAFNQMIQMICELVLNSFADTQFDKAIECCKSLRKSCVQFEEASLFNRSLIQLHSQLITSKKEPFWLRLAAEKIYPIHQDEVSDSAFSKNESEEFYSKATNHPSISLSIQQQNEQTNENLFDELA